MKLIHKHRLAHGSLNKIPMDVDAKVVFASMQDGFVTVWVEKDESGLESRTVRSFRIYPTGVNIEDTHQYVATVMDGPFVWHVYEVK